MIPVFGFSLIFSLLMCVHVVRTQRELYWIFIILIVQPFGGLIYAVVIVLPELLGGRTARRMASATRDTLDPARNYRQARAAHDDSPTVGNSIRLGQAAAAMGRYDEAEELFRDAAQGVHKDDPTLLLGRANALIELGRYAEALTLLERLGADERQGRTPPAALALGRAYEGLGRFTEADTAYDWAAGRLPGLEALARYAAFLAHTGKLEDARTNLAEIDRRISKADPMFRKEGRMWRDLAAQAIEAQA
jgi:hypothetical protein